MGFEAGGEEAGKVAGEVFGLFEWVDDGVFEVGA